MRLRQVHDMFKLSHWLKSHWDTVLAFVLIAYFAVRVTSACFARLTLARVVDCLPLIPARLERQLERVAGLDVNAV